VGSSFSAGSQLALVDLSGTPSPAALGFINSDNDGSMTGTAGSWITAQVPFMDPRPEVPGFTCTNGAAGSNVRTCSPGHFDYVQYQVVDSNK
jgi:hypothetical protein